MSMHFVIATIYNVFLYYNHVILINMHLNVQIIIEKLVILNLINHVPMIFTLTVKMMILIIM